MSLHQYQRKRDFSRTREPGPDAAAPAGARAIFVVQLHHASRRHFDFRLQVGDVLKSWAVPKGPSYDPAVKRLAVEVEDHPLAYAGFEGDIEEGYGKGHVDRFDTGVWAAEGDPEAGLAKGHLRFELFGSRLKGAWQLVRSTRKERQPAWFLIKLKDSYAGKLEADDLLDAKMIESTRRAAKPGAAPAVHQRAAPRARPAPRSRLARAAAALPGARKAPASSAFFAPELARLRESPPAGEHWLHEVKWDGYRILAAVAGGEVKLWSRNALPWNAKLPEVVQAIAGLGLDSARLDGELVALDERGESDFNGLQQTLSGEAQRPLVYVLFDLPYLEGYDLSRTPLVERKTLLQQVLKNAPRPLAYSSHTLGNGEEVFKEATARRLEGIVCKRVDAGYRPGRGDDWVKVKRLESDEFAVVGYTPPKGSRTGFGSLLLARPAADGRGWVYAGKVGTGFSNAQLGELSRTLARKGRPKPTVALTGIDPELRDALWVPPTAVAEVYYRGIGNKQLLRQPSLKTLRLDKSPADLGDGDRTAPASARPPARPQGPERQPHARRDAMHAPRDSARDTPAQAITITHPDRVVYPDLGITKQEVADYYRAVMDGFLPGVAGRPTSVIRCPDGIDKPGFFQKHMMQGLHHVGHARIEEDRGKAADYLCPGDAASVIELVQFGVLEFHPWGATAADPDHADRMVFDLDPGPGVDWPRVVAAARLVRRRLGEAGLESFVRTTGGKGLHVVVPLRPACAWTRVKDFAHAFASALERSAPQEFVAVASKARREGLIFVDYLRNSRGATSVASYSLRARPGAPVAVPVGWQELGRLEGGSHFDIRSAPKRLARQRKDPWAGIDTLEQDLDAALGGHDA